MVEICHVPTFMKLCLIHFLASILTRARPFDGHFCCIVINTNQYVVCISNYIKLHSILPMIKMLIPCTLIRPRSLYRMMF